MILLLVEIFWDMLIVFLLIYTILKIFKGKEIFTVEIKPQTTEFVIDKSGFYALWVQADLFKLNPARAYPAKIFNQDNRLIRHFPMTGYIENNSGFTKAKTVYRTWYLKAGRYYLNVEHQERRFLNPDEQPNARYQLKETMPLMVVIGALVCMVMIRQLFIN